MSTPKHTPGPWRVVSHTIVDSDGDSVIEVLKQSCEAAIPSHLVANEIAEKRFA